MASSIMLGFLRKLSAEAKILCGAGTKWENWARKRVKARFKTWFPWWSAELRLCLDDVPFALLSS